MYSRNIVSIFTVIYGNLLELFDPLFPVVSLICHGRHVLPPKRLHDVHHRLRLVRVRRHHSGEELETPFIAQFDGCGRVADLRDLYKDSNILIYRYIRVFKCINTRRNAKGHSILVGSFRKLGRKFRVWREMITGFPSLMECCKCSVRQELL